MPWPDGWDWELELTPRLEKRMEDREFTGVDLRVMFAQAEGHHVYVVEGQWVIETRHRRHRWHVMVEPDPVERLLVVVTAYPVED